MRTRGIIQDACPKLIELWRSDSPELLELEGLPDLLTFPTVVDIASRSLNLGVPNSLTRSVGINSAGPVLLWKRSIFM